MIYIGVDPGKDGAFAIIDGDKATTIPWDNQTFTEYMRMVSEQECRAVVEHVGAMPGQGVSSMFSFGESFGFIKGVIAALVIPYQLVRPQKWKKEFGCSNKNESISVCKRLFPGVSLRKNEKCRTDHDGMAEALLMAEYARRKMR